METPGSGCLGQMAWKALGMRLQAEVLGKHQKESKGKERDMNIYVGNLSYEVTDENLQEAFAAFGQVSSARVVRDRDTGRSRGFGFVEMPTQAEAQAAIQGLNGKDLWGRTLNVNEARPRAERREGETGRRGRRY